MATESRLMQLLMRTTEEDDDLESKYGGQQIIRRPNRRRRNRDDGQFTILKLASESAQADAQTVSKKKPHFVNLFSQEGENKTVVKLPGRHACDCEARRHKLVNNCLKCGRIVCEQEASGPCFFCGDLVCGKEERQLINSGSKRGRELKLKLMSAVGEDKEPNSELSFATIGDSLKQALEQKEKLLDFDKDSLRRTKVIDDQSDYYAAENNPYLSKEERETLKNRRQELLNKNLQSRTGAQKITLDFMGREVIAEESKFDLDNDPVIQEILQRATTSETGIGDNRISQYFDDLKFDENNSCQFPSLTKPNEFSHGLSGRIQDGDLMKLSDSGQCITIHQPFASLLVRGIKKFEGRTWYTAHRGRLWIASANKQVDSNEAVQIEQFYRKLYDGMGKTSFMITEYGKPLLDYIVTIFGQTSRSVSVDDRLPVEFPEQYQAGVLLGCVELVDCMPQEQYREIYPYGECDDPYVWICENPQEVQIKFPIQGKRKLFQLDSAIMNAAKKMLK